MAHWEATARKVSKSSPITCCPQVKLGHVVFLAESDMPIPSGSLTKSKKVTCQQNTDAMDLGPDCCSMSCQPCSPIRMVHEEQGKADSAEPGLAANPTSSLGPIFERGWFYYLYSSRRNERLRRRRGDEKKSCYGLSVTVESTKRKDSKKQECLRKSVCIAYSTVKRKQTLPRYLRRQSEPDDPRPKGVKACML